MKQTIILSLCLLFVGCQKFCFNRAMSPEFIVRDCKRFNNQWLVTAYNGKWLLSDSPYPKNDTIPLFLP